MRSLALALFLLLSQVAIAQNPSPAAKREIASLFTVLEQSGCKFNRNGSWYGAKKAADHLRRKYDYLLKKNLVTTTESFIDMAASRSSISGKSYLVRCGSQGPVESKAWFTTELIRLRGAAPVGASNSSKPKALRDFIRAQPLTSSLHG